MFENVKASDMAVVLGAVLQQEGIIALHMSAFQGLENKQISITPIEDDDIIIVQLEEQDES